ncbi:MAG: N-formylglutamate amidohydrolase [Campylobacterota bacterium]|nr:N-formylglutamate amidohydrolase [Campylobacterota bacterium]
MLHNILLHIPHASTFIPSWQEYLIDPKGEIELLADWATDRIFDMDGVEKLIFPYSRVFCDVERLVEGEEIESVGMGFYYTYTDDGRLMRSAEHRERVLDEYYMPHHDKLNAMVDKILDKHGEVLIVDCHSFSDTPFKRDSNQDLNRADICLGTTKENTDSVLVERYKKAFELAGYRVVINAPYSGAMIPLKHLGNIQVQTIMVEINRKLYMDGLNIDEVRIKKLNSLMKKIILAL